MKNDRIIASWNKIEPNSAAEERMLSAILAKAGDGRENDGQGATARESISGGTMSAGRKKAFVVLGIAAGLCVLAAAVFAVVYIQKNREPATVPIASADPADSSAAVVPTDSSADAASSSAAPAASAVAQQLASLGLDAADADSTAVITSYEVPYLSREGALNQLKNAAMIADCTVTDISRVIIPETGTDQVWYITVMTLSLNSMIRGETSETAFRVVNAARSNAPVDFLSHPAVENCQTGKRAAFILRPVGADEVWEIGETALSVQELGEYSAVSCIDYDNECFNYQNYSIPLSELD